MRVFLKNAPSFFAWLDAQQFQYAVLWDFAETAAAHDSKPRSDFCILVENRAVAPIAAYCRWVPRLLGRTCDIYSVEAGQGADYLGKAFLPENLGHSALQNRVRHNGTHDVPCDRDRYFVLLFHLAYHLAEESGIATQDRAAFRNCAWQALVRPLGERLGLPVDLSLVDIHHQLVTQGYGIDHPRLVAYLQSHFKRRFKSLFYALSLATQLRGEVNLFVLRAHVVRHGFRQYLLDEIAKHYTLLAVKDIPWLTRLQKARYMRGNKWRWGGWPVVAVVVFDPAPQWRPAEERAKGFTVVFNSRQFFKRELRERIIREGGLHHKQNAMHTTDNEAEAIGHLDLFFSPEEEQALYARVTALRAALGEKDTPGPFDPSR